jgi:putative transposase
MPARKIPLVSGEIYHVLNRGINDIPIFSQANDYHRFITTFGYYQNESPPLKFSYLKLIPIAERDNLLNKMRQRRNWQVDILAYCLMPNHFHFILKQLGNNGIANFIRYVNNSYSHFFNNKYHRKGPLFEGRFKAIHIHTDNQLLHLSRYVHLNPFTSYLIKNINLLPSYPYSSLLEYIEKNQPGICHKSIILDQFPKASNYKKFVFDQAEYQRTLDQIKHQLLE